MSFLWLGDYIPIYSHNIINKYIIYTRPKAFTFSGPPCSYVYDYFPNTTLAVLDISIVFLCNKR